MEAGQTLQTSFAGTDAETRCRFEWASRKQEVEGHRGRRSDVDARRAPRIRVGSAVTFGGTWTCGGDDWPGTRCLDQRSPGFELSPPTSSARRRFPCPLIISITRTLRVIALFSRSSRPSSLFTLLLAKAQHKSFRSPSTRQSLHHVHPRPSFPLYPRFRCSGLCSCPSRWLSRTSRPKPWSSPPRCQPHRARRPHREAV